MAQFAVETEQRLLQRGQILIVRAVRSINGERVSSLINIMKTRQHWHEGRFVDETRQNIALSLLRIAQGQENLGP